MINVTSIAVLSKMDLIYTIMDVMMIIMNMSGREDEHGTGYQGECEKIINYVHDFFFFHTKNPVTIKS